MTSRVGTFQSQSFVLAQITQNTADYVDIQQQITTGKKTQSFSGISDYAALSINLSNSKDTLNQYIEASKTTNSRLDASHNALSNIIDLATKFRAQLLQAMTADQSDEGQINVVSRGYLKQVESGLNTDLGGIYLFGGTKNDIPPVDLSDPIDNAAGTYYTGSSQLLQSRIDENSVLSYGATADHAAFKDLIASLQMVSSAAGNLTTLETALDTLNTSLTNLTQLEAELGHQMSVVEGTTAQNKSVETTLASQVSDIQDVDVSKAMVELTQRQTILQASYLVISKASQLTLTNYLS
jgi:flagellar hook-associated protein 3 FlgL